MNIDVEGQLGAVERSVSALERDAKPARAVVLARSFPTDVEDLWDAVTNGERIARWFVPVSGELAPGGRYQLKDNASGTITACERLSHFALTWEFGEDVSWLEAQIASDGDGSAKLTVRHIAHLSEQWDEYGPGATGVGWDLGLLGLAIHIERPDEPKPDPVAFVTSPDGKAFIAGSSEAWGRAAVAGGTESDAARAAAERTTAFYTGEAG